MEWIGADGKINELIFCRAFCENRPLKYIDGKIYSPDGEQSAEDIKSEIAAQLFAGGITTSIAKRTGNLFDTLKLFCHSEPLPLNDKEIHLQNGVLKTDGSFYSERTFCANRLNVSFNSHCSRPQNFLDFLTALFDDEDILTLQEYLGYCLIPSTKAQTAMFIIGNGGEGKSRIGIILKEIFKGAMITGDFHRVETDRFFRYNLINKLIMVDDDMQLSALKTTGYVKSIITAETPIDVEAKGKQSQQAMLYSRFLCFGNGSPQALYDKSDGFARRLLIISVKPKPQNRVDDPYIADRFIAEKEGIFVWMFFGLRRLLDNDFRFTISEKTKQNLSDAQAENCNIIQFMADREYIEYGNFTISGAELYSAYTLWCFRNTMEAIKKQIFIKWLKGNQSKLKISDDGNVVDSSGHRVRGFRGLHLNRGAGI